jgi:hypothetical protein
VLKNRTGVAWGAFIDTTLLLFRWLSIFDGLIQAMIDAHGFAGRLHMQ